MKEGTAMFRIMSRITAAAAVIMFLAVFTVPTAQARPLNDQAQAVRLDTSWFQAALSWLTGLLPGGSHEPMQRTTATDLAPTAGGGGILQPMTGSCIDPQGGGPRCQF
jgi:hypothetical protein